MSDISNSDPTVFSSEVNGFDGHKIDRKVEIQDWVSHSDPAARWITGSLSTQIVNEYACVLDLEMV